MSAKRLERELVFDLILFIAAIILISLFYRDNLILTVMLILTCLVGFKFWYKKHDAYFFIAAAIIGPVGEIVVIYFGAWSYANPTILGIPVWLPLAW